MAAYAKKSKNQLLELQQQVGTFKRQQSAMSNLFGGVVVG